MNITRNNNQLIEPSKRITAPVSFSQQSLWLLDKLSPNGAHYNIPVAFKLTGQLKPLVLHQSIIEIVRRQASLRTYFQDSNGIPLQSVEEQLNIELPIVNLLAYPNTERERKLKDFFKSKASHKFDLSHAPLLQTYLIHNKEDEYILFLNFHHIIADGWSINLFIKELILFYNTFISEGDLHLAPLKTNYSEYAINQRLSHERGDYSDQLEYWRQQLSKAKPLQLYLDKPHPITPSYNGSSESFELSKNLIEELNSFSLHKSVTLFMTLLTTFKALLYQLSPQNEIIIGSPLAGRYKPEYEDIIGHFVNTLVFRTKVPENPTFETLLERVKCVCIDAYNNQDIPFERIIEALKPERNLNKNPLFQVAFVLVNVPSTQLQMHNVELTSIDLPEHYSKFDLTLTIYTYDNLSKAILNYNSDIFHQSTITNIVCHYKQLLNNFLKSPNMPLLAQDCEIHSIKKNVPPSWHQAISNYPRESSIHKEFEIQVKNFSSRIALKFNHESISYQDLNNRANQLAHYLQIKGIEPNQNVSIALPRSTEFIISMLAILKSGCAYIPLDPDYPEERLAYICEDTQASILITNSELTHKFTKFRNLKIYIDQERRFIDECSTQNPVPLLDSNNLAYIMYTSGSTGKPKGVAIPHRGVLRLVINVNYVHLDNHQRHLLLAPTAFDASTFELWGALLNGSTCIIYPDKIPSIPGLSRELKEHQITTLWLTSSLFNLVVDENPFIFKNVHQLLVGGESLSVKHILKALKSLPDTQIINGYGPTESTTFSCCYHIPRDLKPNTKSIPIGKPITNTEVYILDEEYNSVPIGVTGDLYIGGDGLAIGYYNNEALTSSKFRQLNLDGNKTIRLYESGDKARFLADGNIEFMGRSDHQVKIRGYRIEPAEIENTLLQHPEVLRTSVVAIKNQQSSDCIVAFAVPLNHDFEIKILYNFLADRLPSFMIPAKIILLEDIPLNINGKVNNKALIEIYLNSSIKGSFNHVSPSSTHEIEIAEIFSELLGSIKPSIHDNFFELGGNSLSATQLISRINSVLNRNLSLKCVFEAPTIAGLVKTISQSQSSPDPRINTVPNESAQADSSLINTAETKRVKKHKKISQPLHKDDALDMLSTIWCDVLKIKAVNPDDNFFNMGGHSLLGVKLLYQIEQRFGKQLPLSVIFNYPTINSMIELLFTPPNIDYKTTLVPIITSGKSPPLFLIHGRSDTIERYIKPDQPFYWLHHGLDDGNTPDLTIEEIARIHIRDIKKIQPLGPYYIGGFSFGGLLAFEVTKQLNKNGERVALLALLDPSAPHIIESKTQKIKTGKSSLSLKNFHILTEIVSMLRLTKSSIVKYNRQIKRKTAYIKYYYYKKLNKSFTPEMSIEHTVELFRKTAKQYKYEDCNSKMLIFSPEGKNNSDEKIKYLHKLWIPLAKAGVEIRLVKNASSHHDIVEEPYIKDLMKQFNECLSKAQSLD